MTGCRSIDSWVGGEIDFLVLCLAVRGKNFLIVLPGPKDSDIPDPVAAARGVPLRPGRLLLFRGMPSGATFKSSRTGSTITDRPLAPFQGGRLSNGCGFSFAGQRICNPCEGEEIFIFLFSRGERGVFESVDMTGRRV